MFLLKLARALHIINEKQFEKKRAIYLFKSSELFNSRWYLAVYKDAKLKKMSPEKHYYKYGWKKGYNPSLEFDGNAYLKENQDVKAANINPLEHYLVSGQYEGRYYRGLTAKNNTTPPADSDSLWNRIKYVLTYPIRLQEECEYLKREIKKLKRK